MISSRGSILEVLPDVDLVVNCVKWPKHRKDHLIYKDDLKRMKTGSVIVDVSADIGGGAVETYRATTHFEPTYAIDGVVHYGVDNIPGAAAHTVSRAYAASIVPHIKSIADRGVRDACLRDGYLRRSLTVYKGLLTHEETSVIQGRDFVRPEKALEARIGRGPGLGAEGDQHGRERLTSERHSPEFRLLECFRATKKEGEMKRRSIAIASALMALTSLSALATWAQKADKPVRFRLVSSLTSLDWENTTNVRDMKVWHQMYEGLYGMDESKNGYCLELAKKVDVSKDQKVYTIALQDGVKFQNGDPLKASDVVFSYKRAMKNPRFKYLTSMIVDVAAVNDKTVKITLDKPYAPIGHTFFCIKILSEKEVTAQGAKFGTIPNKAGTGAYFASAYDIGSGVKLQAFKDYWRGEPAIKSVEYVVISDESAAVIAYENGELDYFEDVPLSAWKDLSKVAGENGKLIKGNNIMFMAINYLSPKKALADLKVRQAICYAINKKDINLGVCDGYGVEATQYMPSEYVATAPVSGFKTYDYNPELAKKLLAEAGYPHGLDVGTILTYGASTSNNAKMAQVLQANLEEVGITAAVSVMEASVVTPKLYVQDYDICIFADSMNYDFNNIRQQVHSESKGMYVVKFKDGPFNWKRLEELVDLGVSTVDTAQRRAYYTELWSIVMDTATILPCLHRPVGIVWSKGLNIGQPVPTFYKIRTFSKK